jgi:hypothetical protein
MTFKPFVNVAALTAVLSAAATAHAQWTVTLLHPAGATHSHAMGVGASGQWGSAVVDTDQHASLWSGTAASWVDLHPAGALDSFVYAADGGRQAGEIITPDILRHAGLWSGTAASWVDLHPTGATESVAFAMSGTQQVGAAMVNGIQHAGFWSGTAASWVDLNPAGADGGSGAYATSGGRQGGVAMFGVVQRASLWSGTAASRVDLHPAGADMSRVHGMTDSQQAGVTVLGNRTYASLWSGTAASWVNLNPAGATDSWALAASGSMQVGYALLNGQRAGLWSGTAESWVDLHAQLPGGGAGFLWSQASGIWSDGISTYVVGQGWNMATNRAEALLWTMPVPAPGAAAMLGLAGVLVARRRR